MREDKVIAILRGIGAAKRAPRKAQVTLTVEWYDGAYFIQSNGKVVEQGDGTADYANDRAKARATAIRVLGKTCIVERV